MKPPPFPSWTPPIFGWHYWLSPANDRDFRVSGGTLPVATNARFPYTVFVAGERVLWEKTPKIDWHVFFTVPHPLYRVAFHARGFDLKKVVHEIESQVAVLRRAVHRLERDLSV